MESLSQTLFAFHGVDSDRVRLVVETTQCRVNIQPAVPLALILNELLSNALKHAFPDRRTGSIQVGVKSKGAESVLRVADDGVGLPTGTPIGVSSSSLGLQLVRVLVEQLCGRLEVHSPPGTTYAITFPSKAGTDDPGAEL